MRFVRIANVITCIDRSSGDIGTERCVALGPKTTWCVHCAGYKVSYLIYKVQLNYSPTIWINRIFWSDIRKTYTYRSQYNKAFYFSWIKRKISSFCQTQPIGENSRQRYSNIYIVFLKRKKLCSLNTKIPNPPSWFW